MDEASLAEEPQAAEADSSPLVLDRKRPLTAQVYEILRTRIITLDLKPGATVSKSALARSMGISQTPVREAILRLEEEGLVDVFPQSRTAVTLLDLRQAREVQIMRITIEAELARALAGKADKELIATLAARIDEQTDTLEREDFEAFARADAEFHAAQYRFCQVGGLWDLVMRRRGHMDRFRRLYLPVHDKERQVLIEHKAIFKAIKAGKPEDAAETTQHHLSRTFQVCEQIVAAHPDYFPPGTADWLETLRSTPRILEGESIM